MRITSAEVACSNVGKRPEGRLMLTAAFDRTRFIASGQRAQGISDEGQRAGHAHERQPRGRRRTPARRRPIGTTLDRHGPEGTSRRSSSGEAARGFAEAVSTTRRARGSKGARMPGASLSRSTPNTSVIGVSPKYAAQRLGERAGAGRIVRAVEHQPPAGRRRTSKRPGHRARAIPSRIARFAAPEHVRGRHRQQRVARLIGAEQAAGSARPAGSPGPRSPPAGRPGRALAAVTARSRPATSSGTLARVACSRIGAAARAPARRRWRCRRG